MQFRKRVIYSSLVSSATLISSMILPIVPCRTAPSVPNPTYSWALCNLNADKLSISIKEYFGFTNSIKDSYFLILFLTFAVSMVFFHYTANKKKE